ncbi:hypothetical protein OAK49_05090, partial [Euryarchaeota archaeon]|nr:hypothetical protein [Euryarchaeota archaeon]
TNTNDAPTVASAISDVSTAEDAAYSLDVSGTCTDVDASDTMSYSIWGAKHDHSDNSRCDLGYASQRRRRGSHDHRDMRRLSRRYSDRPVRANRDQHR